MIGLNKVNRIYFKYSTGPYGRLHNFSPFRVIIGDNYYSTSEHLYQSLKYLDKDKQKLIRNQSSPKQAATIGRSLNGIREDWSLVKLDAMKFVLYAKLISNLSLARKLIETGNTEIIELSNYDTFWGKNGKGMGENNLGKLWMQIREEIKDTSKFNSDGDCVYCLSIPEFCCPCSKEEIRLFDKFKKDIKL